jgi:hypothetical protein
MCLRWVVVARMRARVGRRFAWVGGGDLIRCALLEVKRNEFSTVAVLCASLGPVESGGGCDAGAGTAAQSNGQVSRLTALTACAESSASAS